MATHSQDGNTQGLGVRGAGDGHLQALGGGGGGLGDDGLGPHQPGPSLRRLPEWTRDVLAPVPLQEAEVGGPAPLRPPGGDKPVAGRGHHGVLGLHGGPGGVLLGQVPLDRCGMATHRHDARASEALPGLRVLWPCQPDAPVRGHLGLRDLPGCHLVGSQPEMTGIMFCFI